MYGISSISKPDGVFLQRQSINNRTNISATSDIAMADLSVIRIIKSSFSFKGINLCRAYQIYPSNGRNNVS
jgi:hypothetical protein